MEEAEFKKIEKPLLRFVEDYTLDLSYRMDLIAKYYHLTKKDRYKIHPLKTEIAFEHNEIANKSKDEQIPIKIFDKQDGKLRAEVDMSKGFPEFEFKHPKKSWSDGMNFTDTMQQLFDGRFNQFQNGVMEDIRMIVDNQKYFAENLSKHVKAIEELTKMAKGVQDYLKTEPLNTKKGLNWVEIRDGVEILR